MISYIKKLSNSLLIPYGTAVGEYPEANDSDIKYSTILVNNKGEQKDFNMRFYWGSEGFDKERKTMLFFHGNKYHPATTFIEKTQKYNVLFVEYLPYKQEYSDQMKDLNVDIDLIVEQCIQGIHELDKKLKTDKYYGTKYKRENEIIFVGHSLGTFVATKTAARLAQNSSEQGSKKVASAILNICPPIDMRFAAKGTVKIKLQQSPRKCVVVAIIYIAVLTLLYGISLAILYAVNKKLKLDSILSLIAPAIAAIISIVIAIIVLQTTKGIGISKNDIVQIEKDNNLYFVSFEGDYIALKNASEQVLKYCDQTTDSVKIVTIERGPQSTGNDTRVTHNCIVRYCDIEKILEYLENEHSDKGNKLQGSYTLNIDPNLTHEKIEEIIADLHVKGKEDPGIKITEVKIEGHDVRTKV